MPKRKFDEVDSEGVSDEAQTGDSVGSEDSNSSVHTSSSTDVPCTETTTTAGGLSCSRRGKRVKFQGVTVFYFQRKQGFVCVPSQGGSTLGMCESHTNTEDFSIKEFARHQRQLHRNILAQQRGTKYTGSLSDSRKSSDNGSDSDSSNSSDDDDLNVDDYYFLQPVPTRQRRLMLRQAGIKKIDTLEKEECKDIRTSRESCGCDCRVYCEPETCACSLAGIKCQVDRLSFPCGCSKEGCGNQSGRIEFNPIRVRTHFIHTLMRLEMDKKKEEEQILREKRIQENGPTQAESSPVCPELVTDPDPPNVNSSLKSDTDDVMMYNSNERGSCCDCQNSDIHEFMMQESQFNGAVNGAMNSGGQHPNAGAEYMAAGGGSPAEQSNGNHIKAGENLPQVLLFNDSDDDYNGENPANIYPFNKEDSSYSESSDCSSEASVSESEQNHAGSFPNFPDNPTTYDVNTAGLGPSQAGNFCMQPSVLQPDSKYLDLGESSSSFKLEPISEILNPVRFPGYAAGSPGSSWCGENYAGFACGDGPNGQVDPNSSFCSSEVPKGREYLYSGDTDGSSSTDSLGPILSPSAQMPEQYLEPAYENGVSMKSFAVTSSPKPHHVDSQTNGSVKIPVQNSSKSELEREEKSYHDLTKAPSGTPDPAVLSILPLPSPQKVNRCKEPSPAPLLDPSQTSLTIVEVNKLGAENDVKSHNLTNPTSGSEPKPQENKKPSNNVDLKKYEDLSQSCAPKKLCTRVAHKDLLSEGYTLPQSPAVYAVTENTSPSEVCNQSNSPNLASTNAKLGGAKETSTVENQSVNGVEGSGSISQNFGEVIKESIVETVSA